MSGLEDIGEEAMRDMRQASEARETLALIGPEVAEFIRVEVVEVQAHMKENKGVLDSDFAVQAWYRVFAAVRVEQLLGKIEKRGVKAARAVEATRKR